MSQYQPPQQPNPWGQQPSQPLPPQGYPQQPYQQPQWQGQPQYPQQQPGGFQQPPKKTRKPLSRGTKIGCGVVAAVVVLVIIIAVAASANGNSNTPAAQATQAATQPTTHPTQAPQVVHYPPKTLADLRGLAAKGDASAIHEFHGESVGLTGVCPQPKREVTIDPKVTGQQLAEDLLAYFYGQQLDSPCGSLVLAYHTQAEANDVYTAGRISFDTTDSSGVPNVDPNATNLKYALTLDIGGDFTGQEYVVTY